MKTEQNKESGIKLNYWEFDPGSGLTLAACLIHASRTRVAILIIVKQNYWIIGVGAFLVIFCLFLFVPLQKALIRRQVKKKPTDSYVIDVKCASRLKYQLSSEENAPLIDYQNIYKVRKTPNYIYMHMGVYSVVIIKLDACEAKEELVEFIKSKYVGTNKYKELKK